MRIKVIILFLLFVTYRINHADGQVNIPTDTLRLTIQKAEEKFLSKNILLLAEKCNIDAAKASIIQAKLWDNPTLNFEQNIYNFSTGKAFDFTKTGNTAFDVSQLFLLAGKRNKKVGLEQINLQKSEYTFYELIRTLKYELRTTFFDTYYLIQSLNIYDKEINSLSKTIGIYDTQYSKGNISLVETTRLKAFFYGLESEKNDIKNKLIEKQADLNLLLHNNGGFIIPVIDREKIDSTVNKIPTLISLLDTASNNRYDLHIQELDVCFATSNLTYQKSLSVPDVTVDIQAWNRAGGYVQNYNALMLQFSLPLWNRNQGNIKIAKSQIDNSKYLLENYKDVVRNDVLKAYSKAVEADNLYKNQKNSFGNDFEKLANESISNYEKRNISMIEFIDFYDSYKNYTIQHNGIENNRVDIFEELNYSVGKNIFNF